VDGYRHLVALGSSFAAGPGIDPVVDRAAGRSGRNYAHLLAERLGARLTDLTVSGATTATILEQPQRTLRRRFPPQVAGLPADADLVTITAGGNDLGYIGGLTRAAFAGRLARRPLTRRIGRAILRTAIPAATDEDVEGAATGLVRVVRAVRARVPEATVVLVDYLPVLGPATATSREVPLRPVDIAAFRNVAAGLDAAFEAAAGRTGAQLLRASVLGAEHALGSPRPWVTGYRPGRGAVAFHPNAAGMAAVAGALVDLLSGVRGPTG
jgi:lysophospholipase L1-like esterase